MRVGFTGTRDGMTHLQYEHVADLLSAIVRALATAGGNEELVGLHGDCIGADAEFSEMCYMLGFYIELYPPIVPSGRAWCEDGVRLVHPEQDYLDRNHAIVDSCDVLIGGPKGPEVQRSGTWATLRYARKIGKPWNIVDPEGLVYES